MKQPIKGRKYLVVDQEGATFVYPTWWAGLYGFYDERRRGAVALSAFTVRAPRHGMTWDELAEYACSHGPDKTRFNR
jgi:hypothetical protein